MSSLDILMLGLNYAPESTGIAPYTHATAQAWADAGHRVHVVSGFPHYPQWAVADGYRGMRMREHDGAVRVTRVRHPVPADPTGPSRIAMEAAFATATATVAHRTPDVVVAVSPALLSVGAALSRRATAAPGRRPAVGAIVQDLYGSAVEETGVLGGHAGGSVARAERALLGRADGVVAVHEAFRPRLASYGIAPEAISVIRNWTHIRPATGDPLALRRALGWPTDRVIALHAGNMGAKQALENVVAAARRAEQHRMPLEFVLLGDGSRRGALEELGRGCANLRFVDPLPDGVFETALAAADVLVLNERATVRQMCIPSKLTSYFASGRPVVAATYPTSPAAVEVRASGAGMVIEPERPDLLTRTASWLGRYGREHGARGPVHAATACAAGPARAAYVEWIERLAGATRPTPARVPG